MIFGTSRKPGFPPILFHTLAAAGANAFHFMALALYVAFTGAHALARARPPEASRPLPSPVPPARRGPARATGTAAAKKALSGVLLSWLTCMLAVQWTHPWDGEQPRIDEMPTPLLLAIIGLVAAGAAMEQ